MLGRTQLLDTIDGIYAARVRGDKQALAAVWAPDGAFRIVGADAIMPTGMLDETDPAQAVAALVDRFRFHEVDRLEAVVEGDRAAVRSRILASTDGHAPVELELLDLWCFTDDGRVASLVQFVDTARVAKMLR